MASGVLGCSLLAALVAPARVGAAPAPLQFSVFARTGLPLGDVLWTGNSFVYTVEGRRALYTTGAAGQGLRVFASVPRNNGEMRCILSPGAHGFPAHTLYCHAAQGEIYRISGDGRTIIQIAMIPTPKAGSDGSLTYDAGGAFGYTLLAATGGSDAGSGGAVYAMQPGGQVRRVGAYGGPGGAEHIAMAPAGFGSVAGQVLITTDKHDHQGRLLVMDARGHVRTLVGGLTWGLDPIAAIPGTRGGTPQAAQPGLYLADWLSHNVLFAPAADFRPFAGDLFVAAERRNHLYVLRPQGAGYSLIPLRTNLHLPDSNYEGACFVTG